MFAQVTYNARLRQYEVTAADNGRKISAHPAGKAGQREAEQAAISHNDPQLYALAYFLEHANYNGRPDAISRLWRAAEIAASGHVMEPYSVDGSETVARVKSQNPAPIHHGQHHRIERHGYRLTCSCSDFSSQNCPEVRGQKLCKHVLAVKLMRVLERPFGAWPPPDERDQWLLNHTRRQR